MSRLQDKNFDLLADRFESRIYGGLKGEIRQAVIWRDLLQHSNIKKDPPLKVLDIGAGLGYFSIKLAQQGHHVTYNDISSAMMQKAQQQANAAQVDDHIIWNNAAYQTFTENYPDHFDLILCHAVLEWLEEPQYIFSIFNSLLKPQAYLSLCFYNPVGLTYRNLICGNFRYLDRLGLHQADPNSLTPQNPCTIEQVRTWLDHNHLDEVNMSGIRVFSDYVLQKRGGNESPEEVLRVELDYSQREPYKNMGRYIHIVARKS